MTATRRRTVLIIGVLIVVIAAAVVFFRIGAYLEGPAGHPEPSDVIFPLGGDTGSRIALAKTLYDEGYGRIVRLSGLENGALATRPALLGWRGAYLIEAGIPQTALDYDPVSQNSWDEAVNMLAFLETHALDRVIVISEPPHMRRLAWTWATVFDGSGKSFFLVSTKESWWDAARWWRNEHAAVYVFSEIVKLIYYWVRYP